MSPPYNLADGTRKQPLTHQERLEKACIDVVRATSAVASCIWLWDEDADALQASANFRLNGEYLAYGNQVSTTAIAKERAPIYRACRLGVPVETHGPMRDSEFAYFTHEFAHLGIETIYVMPIILNGIVFGSLALYFERPYLVREVEALKIQLVATEIAASLIEHNHARTMAARTRELEELNAVLAEKVHHLRELTRMKSDLLGIIGHELRTPLTAIVGYGEILQRHAEQSGDPEALRYLAEIETSSRRLTEVIEDGMTASLIDDGKLRITMQDYNVVELVRQLIDAFGPRFADKGIAVSYEGPVDPVVTRLDARWAARALASLIGNAIKFSQTGTQVRVAVAAGADEVAIGVSDRGVGIPADHLPYIFQKYYQVNSSNTRKHDGLGLGLAIARSIAEAHGGTIDVASEPNEGSRFTLRLPR